MKVNETVTLKGINLEACTKQKRMDVTKEKALEVFSKDRNGNIDGRFASRAADCGLCPIPLFTEEAFQLLNLHNVLDGTRRVRTPDEYNALPAKYIEACEIITAENNRINRSQGGGG